MTTFSFILKLLPCRVPTLHPCSDSHMFLLPPRVPPWVVADVRVSKFRLCLRLSPLLTRRDTLIHQGQRKYVEDFWVRSEVMLGARNCFLNWLIKNPQLGSFNVCQGGSGLVSMPDGEKTSRWKYLIQCISDREVELLQMLKLQN